MKKIKEVIVVEGRDDTRRIQESVEADTIETNGSAINATTLQLIAKAQQERGVIVFTDPDFPGEKIRKTISQAVPGVKHAFLTRDESRPKHKGSLGIEHADPETIRTALSRVYTEMTVQEEWIPRSLLAELGLVIGPFARLRREQLGEKLHIGYTNGKQLQKRLRLFQIKPEQLIEAVKEIEEEKDGSL
ncbi:ribonuclease M5 [Pisciglobus halotolerans]|uniref:Ribonuclease M5 n=1 Tax=Pisciglobus halotolerans TaxID=745365 RepID=A0A1I3CYP2_9LACT|nr:ribonuclease M5 [Pisciglobus halotolerans]SFH79547.1 RNAse M5 [Pisciglobus halotolerans]